MPGRLAKRTERRGEAPPCHGFSPFAHQSLVDRFRFSAEYSAPLARRQCHAGTWQRWCTHTVNCSPRCAFLLPITKNGCCHRLIAYSFCACFWSLRSLSLGVCLAVWLWTLAAPQSGREWLSPEIVRCGRLSLFYGLILGQKQLFGRDRIRSIKHPCDMDHRSTVVISLCDVWVHSKESLECALRLTGSLLVLLLRLELARQHRLVDSPAPDPPPSGLRLLLDCVPCIERPLAIHRARLPVDGGQPALE